jgi:hypothetical protein
MAAPLDAIESISAAWNRAVELLFKPFRWSFWWRMAFLAFMTGEMSSGGNFNVPGNLGGLGNRSGHRFLAAPWDTFGPGLIAALAVAAFVFVIVFMYLGCVFRFVLFDAVLTGRHRLREGFGRWQHHGTRLFWWSLGYFLIMMSGVGIAALVIVMGVRGMKAGAGTSILGIVLGVLAILVLLVIGLTVFVLTKDFVIPIMAFEGSSTTEAWGKLWRMIKEKPVDYLAYIGMKIVLTVGAGIISGIASVAIIVVMLIIGVIVGLFVAATHPSWNPATIALAVVAGLVALLFVFFFMGMIAAPFATFFQAYAIYFFGRRFRPLEMVVYPEPPAPPPAPAAPPAPEPPPSPPAIVPA